MTSPNIYVAVVECSDAAIVAKDIGGLVLIWNAAAERLLGYSETEMKGRSVARLLPPGRGDEDERILARIRTGEEIAPFLTQRRHKSGRLVDVGLGVSPMRGERGQIIGVSYIARDATAFIEQQRRLQESEARFLSLANHMPQLAWIATADGRMEWCNDRWVQYTGKGAEAMDPGAWRDIVHPDQLNAVLESFSRAVREGREWEDTFQIRGRDGAYRWFLTRAEPVKDGAGKILNWMGTNTDVTEEHEQSEQIRMLMMEVNHRSKNMLSMVQALVRRSAPGEQGFAERFSERIRSLAINQDILVRRQWREVPLAELVTEQLAFAEGAPGGVTLSGIPCSLVPSAAEVFGMALHELATNSLKYGALSVKGGQVEIGWECTPGCSVFHIWWRESGGPPVVAPTRKGFGTTLIREVPHRKFGCDVTLTYEPDGLYWSLRCDDRILVKPICSMMA